MKEGLTKQQLAEIEERLKWWDVAINALGSDAIELDRQRNTDQTDLLREVKRLNDEVERWKMCARL